MQRVPLLQRMTNRRVGRSILVCRGLEFDFTDAAVWGVCVLCGWVYCMIIWPRIQFLLVFKSSGIDHLVLSPRPSSPQLVRMCYIDIILIIWWSTMVIILSFRLICLKQTPLKNLWFSRKTLKCWFKGSLLRIKEETGCFLLRAPHLWILTVLWANRADFLCESLLTATISGQEEEGVAQQTILCSGQQLLVSERIWVATPVVHDGVPVAIRERENSLKHSEKEKQSQVFSRSSDIWKCYQLLSLNKQSFLRAREDQNTKEENQKSIQMTPETEIIFQLFLKMYFHKMNVSM